MNNSKRGILSFFVVLILLSLVFLPSLNADEKSNSGADLEIIDFELFDLTRYYGWHANAKGFIQNVGNDVYTGKLFFEYSTRPVFSITPIGGCKGAIGFTDEFDLDIGEELNFSINGGAYFGNFLFPYFYWVHLKIEPHGYDCNSNNNELRLAINSSFNDYSLSFCL